MINDATLSAMTSLARTMAILIGAALAACAWLSWAGSASALAIPLKTLWDPGQNLVDTPAWYSTLAFAVWLAGALIVLAGVSGSRATLIVGALIAAATAVTWVLANAASTSAAAVTVSNIKVGAYAAIALGLIGLLVAALAKDTATPRLR
jgi:hypothetical protein